MTQFYFRKCTKLTTVVALAECGKSNNSHLAASAFNHLRLLSLWPHSLGVGIGGMRQRIKEFGGGVRLQNANPGTLVGVQQI
jgi:hypothetical protein